MFKTPRRLDRRLDRRNAAKNIAYSPSPRPLNLNPTNNNINNQSSFRVGDGDGNGDLDLLLYNLGLTGPEDFAISADAWEASRPHRSSSSSSDPLPRSRLSSSSQFQESEARVCDSRGISGARPPVLDPTKAEAEAEVMVLARSAPPTVSGTPEDKMVGSSWHQEDEEEIASTSNYGDSEEMLVMSPERKFRRRIESWIRGQLLGSGSFGTVYEAISHDGFFFALKEVSLLDQGNNAQQCILQLEQEITLLSQFEHENIVQYLGTDKEKAKLFIFIELVTQGSLASLYQKYHLQDSQVSSYTRQILKGLNYLHERNVVHRDIKCANILVHANGSVKLADFGLAKEMSKINMLKSCKGSVYWMAPEVVNPRKTYGPAADIWSLGCTVLEMLTRQIPHPDLEWQHAFFKIGRGLQPPVPSNLSKDARDFIAQCVQVNPDDRPAASQLLDHPFVKSRLPYSLRLGSDYSSSPGRDR